MSENKTVPTNQSVAGFLDSIAHASRQADARSLVELMTRATGAEPRMWGPAIIGFGTRAYRYETGRTGEIFQVGFSPRKANLVLYLTSEGADRAGLLARLGKHKTGASCLYVNRLTDVDVEVLEALIRQSWQPPAEAA